MHGRFKCDAILVYISSADAHEVVMADESRYKNTTTTLQTKLLSEGDILLDLSNIFEERPCEVTQRYTRVDIYLSLKEIMRLLSYHKLVPLKYDEYLEKAPYSNNYQIGYKSIPRPEEIPLLPRRLDVKNFYLRTPLWEIQIDKITKKVFIEPEVDRNRDFPYQLHIGIQLPTETEKFVYRGSKVSIGSLVEVNLTFILPSLHGRCLYDYVRKALAYVSSSS